jgi:hypothetical protein
MHRSISCSSVATKQEGHIAAIEVGDPVAVASDIVAGDTAGEDIVVEDHYNSYFSPFDIKPDISI